MDWREQIAQHYDDIESHNCLGIRATCEDENYQVGDCARNSLDWDFENDCPSENELNGTCAIEVDNYWLDGPDDLISRIEASMELAERYHGKQVVLLGGQEATRGEDVGESIIQNAQVLVIIQ